jgi:hypothetical protein
LHRRRHRRRKKKLKIIKRGCKENKGGVDIATHLSGKKNNNKKSDALFCDFGLVTSQKLGNASR